MNSSLIRPSSARRNKKMSVPLALAWSHCGVSYRVTPWPEVRFECLYGEDWIPTSPTEDALASAAQTCGPLEWRPFLEFVPPAIRELLARFSFARMEALQVVARCPALLADLAATPALTAFVASHAHLRGTADSCWNEINAVHERSGIFGLLEWLGLPASPQTLAILQNIAEPDVPKRFLEPLRTMLWEPRTIFALQRTTTITDRQLARFCHALAA
ncbi:MAG TPA: hypothetical protein VHD62_18355 [Opitutaceae bacterium]|nr:hypothetical protein [Opitutaceae bacterium]